MKNSLYKLLFRLLPALLLFLFIAGCVEDKFDLKRLSDDMQLSPKFSAPLVRGNITLEDLVDDGGENIVYDSSGAQPFIKFVYREDSIFSFDGSDLFEVNESGSDFYTLGSIEIDGFGPINESISFRSILENADTRTAEANIIAAADGGISPIPPIEKSDSMAISGDFEAEQIDNFRYAVFESGQIEITLTNNLPVEVSAEFCLRTKIFDKSGFVVEQDLMLRRFEFNNLPPNSTLTLPYDLANDTLGSVLYATELSISTPGSGGTFELIKLDEQGLIIEAQSNELIIKSGDAAIPAQTLQSQTTGVSIGSTGDERLDTIKLSGGGLDYTIQNNTNITASLNINLPNSYNASGGTLGLNLNIPPTSTTTGSLDLTGSKTILNGLDSLPIEYNVRLENTQEFVEFDASDHVSFDYGIQLNSNHIDYISGYFGEDTLDFEGDVLETGIDLFNNVSGGFTLTDPSMKLFYNNTIGIPFTADLELIGESGDGTQQDLNEGDANGFLQFQYPTIPYSTIHDTLVFNKNTSDIVDFISLPPKKIRFTGTGYINHNTDPSIQNFITSDNHVNVGMEMDLPLELKTSGLTYRDSISFEVDFDFDEAVTLFGIFKNGFPFSVDIQVICRDSITNTELFTMEALNEAGEPASLLEAPEVENSRVTTPKENLVYFRISGNDVELLNETNQLVMIATVNTSGAEGVRFYTDYSLDFKLGIDETGTRLDF